MPSVRERLKMSELHDNTRPSRDGSFAVSKHGLISYFPVEAAHELMPSMALIIKEKDGNLTAAIDIRQESVRFESE